jgi:hypothetical protein
MINETVERLKRVGEEGDSVRRRVNKEPTSECLRLVLLSRKEAD